MRLIPGEFPLLTSGQFASRGGRLSALAAKLPILRLVCSGGSLLLLLAVLGTNTQHKEHSTYRIMPYTRLHI